MNSKKIKLTLRNLKNKITGKQDIIDDYNLLTNFLATVSDSLPQNSNIRQQILQQLDIITEFTPIYEGGATVVSTYNPYTATKSATRAKLAELYKLTTLINQNKNIPFDLDSFCRGRTR